MRTTHRARALVLGALPALLLFGSGCVVPEYRPDQVTYTQPQQPTRYYAYYGGHVIPERYGGGWCFIQGLHYHVYPPDYAEYYQDDDGYYSYQGPVSFYYYGPHPIPAADGGGWCYRHGRHVHHYHPGYNLGWHYQPTYRYYYWDPSHPDTDNGRYHPAEPVYRRSHPVYVTPGHPANGGGSYAGRPINGGNGGGYAGHPANGGNGGGYAGHPAHGGNGGGYAGHPANGGNGGGYAGHPINGGNGGGYAGHPAHGGNGGNGGSSGNGGFRRADPGIGNGHPVPGSVDLGPIEGSGQPASGHPTFHPAHPQAPTAPSQPTFHPMQPQRPTTPAQPTFHPMQPQRPTAPAQPTFHPMQPQRPMAPSQPTFHPMQPQRPTSGGSGGFGGSYHPPARIQPPVSRPVTLPVGGGTRGGHGFVPEKARKAKNGAEEKSRSRGHPAGHRASKRLHR